MGLHFKGKTKEGVPAREFALEDGIMTECHFLFLRRSLCCPGWSAVVQSRLTASFTSRVQVILLPRPPE